MLSTAFRFSSKKRGLFLIMKRTAGISSSSSKKVKNDDDVKITSSSDNPNAQLVEALKELGAYEKVNNRFKSAAYFKAANAIKGLSYPITSGKDTQKIDGVGKKIGAKIDEILATGKLKKLEGLRSDETATAHINLGKVYGVGPVAARNFVEAGILTIEDLAKVQTLTSAQKIGVKYHKDIQEKIPREEVSIIERQLKNVIANLDREAEATICGSYRRGLKSSGDVDVLLTHPSFTTQSKDKGAFGKTFLKTVVDKLKSSGVIIETLSLGPTKFMGICRVLEDDIIEDNDKYLFRRLDIRLVPKDQYACGILYFTGSMELNKKMRIEALKESMSLNEYSICPVGSTGVHGPPLPVSCEKDVFDYLNMDYLEPSERDL